MPENSEDPTGATAMNTNGGPKTVNQERTGTTSSLKAFLRNRRKFLAKWEGWDEIREVVEETKERRLSERSRNVA